jgi:hypothetical protein
MVWVNATWNDSLCVTNGITALGDGTAKVSCDCKITGFIAVFLLQSNQAMVMLPEVYTFNQTLQFT